MTTAFSSSVKEERPIMDAIAWVILVILVLFVLGTAPVYHYSADWGYFPSGIGTLVLVLLVIWLFFGRR
jgi:hypothetical protein